MSKGSIFAMVMALVFLFGVVSVPLRAEARELSASSPLSVRMYVGIIGLTPDAAAENWLRTYTTKTDLENLTVYLLDIVYGKRPSQDIARGIYVGITGLTPDDRASAWLATHTSKQNLKDLASYLLSITMPVASAPSRPAPSGSSCDPSAISVPVLMYHYVHPAGEPSGDHWWITYDQLESQMQWLHNNGFSTITVDELHTFITEGKIHNPRSVVLIFDDSAWYNSVKYRVLPLMRKYGFIATLALDTGHVYTDAEHAFTWDELRVWENEGVVDVQSHSVTHPLIPALQDLSDAALWAELAESKATIEAHLSKTVNGFITPGGSVDDRVLAFAQKAGYKTFFLLWENPHQQGARYHDDPMWIYRMNMVRDLDFTAFVKKMQTWATPVNACPVQSSGDVLTSTTVVAYYGHPNTVLLGILGEYDPETLAQMIIGKAQEYDAVNGKKGVTAAFYLIYGTVQPGGNIGLLDSATVQRYIEVARRHGMLVILDHQIGRFGVESAINDMLPYAQYDNVHFSIDPEWATATPGAGGNIGSISGYDINHAQEIIQQYLEQKSISGKKILIVHQFQRAMISSREAVHADYSRVVLVHDADGFGSPAVKYGEYAMNAEAANMPIKGIKLFYQTPQRQWGVDIPLLTPQEVMGLDPQPSVVIYQ